MGLSLLLWFSFSMTYAETDLDVFRPSLTQLEDDRTVDPEAPDIVHQFESGSILSSAATSLDLCSNKFTRGPITYPAPATYKFDVACAGDVIISTNADGSFHVIQITLHEIEYKTLYIIVQFLRGYRLYHRHACLFLLI